MIEKGGGIRDGTEGRKVRSKRCDYILKLKIKDFTAFILISVINIIPYLFILNSMKSNFFHFFHIPLIFILY